MPVRYKLLLNPIYRAKRGFHIDNDFTPLAIATLGFISYKGNFYTKLCLFLALRKVPPISSTQHRLSPIINIGVQKSPVLVLNSVTQPFMFINLNKQILPSISTKVQKGVTTYVTHQHLSIKPYFKKRNKPLITLTRNDTCG